MKTIAVISGLASGIHLPGGGVGGISSSLLEDLCRIHPEGRTGSQGHAFASELPLDDPRTAAILERLRNNGMQPWQGRGDRHRDREFSYYLSRVWDDTDLVHFDYLELCPVSDDMYVPGDGRIGGNTIAQMCSPGKASISLLGVGTYTYIAVQRARDALESANLIGLKFLPVEKTYESVDYDLFDEEDTWWELESDIELPPLAPSMTLETRDGRPFQGDFSEGCVRRDGFYTHPELHYRRADLERIGPFDAARTFEHFHPRGPAPRSRAFVVSQKFYQVCRDNGIKTRFVPVRIDD